MNIIDLLILKMKIKNIFNTINVTNMMKKFWVCSSLKELNLSNFNTINVTNMNDMFNGCSDEFKKKIKSKYKNIKGMAFYDILYQIFIK